VKNTLSIVESDSLSMSAWAVLLYIFKCIPHLELPISRLDKLSQVKYTQEDLNIGRTAMLKHDEYIAFKQRAKKHIIATLTSFNFWGEQVGRIAGDIKEKFGEARWYADLDRPANIHEIVYLRYPYRTYNWDPTKGLKFKVLDFLNNMSMMIPFLLYIFVAYRLFFYNVAYWVAFIKNPDCAPDILSSADYPKKILFGRSFAKFMRWRDGRRKK
jgi:hypothetical protein